MARAGTKANRRQWKIEPENCREADGAGFFTDLSGFANVWQVLERDPAATTNHSSVEGTLVGPRNTTDSPLATVFVHRNFQI